jgi:CRP-like cAMP-binding protein
LRQNYLRYLSGRIRFLSARLQALAAGGAEGKLSRYLLENAAEGALVCPATELAQRLGISRASLYRAFQALEDAGLIQRRGKTILVPDPAALGSAL